MTTIDCIGDLHGYFPPMPGGDILIITGDCTTNDRVHSWQKFFDWLDKCDYKHKVLVAGNHDNFCKSWAVSGTFTNNDYEQMYPGEKPVMEYLCDSAIEIDGLKIWGTPWSLDFPGISPHCTAFTGSDAELAEHFSLIPAGIDILVSHGPPFGVLDMVWDYETGYTKHCGSRSLLQVVERVKPLYMVFGHIHEYGGQEIKHGDTICYNVAHVDQRYRAKNGSRRIII